MDFRRGTCTIVWRRMSPSSILVGSQTPPFTRNICKKGDRPFICGGLFAATPPIERKRGTGHSFGGLFATTPPCIGCGEGFPFWRGICTSFFICCGGRSSQHPTPPFLHCLHYGTQSSISKKHCGVWPCNTFGAR